MVVDKSSNLIDLQEFYDKEWREHQKVAVATQKTLGANFSRWVDLSAHALKEGKKLLFFGNGGSAADAQHLATELTVRYKNNRKALPALALTTDTSALTAIANDMGFEFLFSRQIEAFGNKGDIAIGISTSGQSPNVLKAFQTAREQGLITIGLTGSKSTEFSKHADLFLSVPSQTTARIQEMHITLGQMFCGALELQLGLV